MSAYIVSKAHIDALTDVACNGPSGVTVSPMNTWRFSYYLGGACRIHVLRPGLEAHEGERSADEIGQILVDENVRSVEYRYPRAVNDDGGLPGPIAAYYGEPYTLTPRRRSLTAVETLAALSCYEYQACEAPDWEKSEAYKLCDALRRLVIHFLPGYDAAGWEIKE